MVFHKESVGNKRHLKSVPRESPNADSKNVPAESRPKEPCVGKSEACKKLVPPDAPWGRVVMDGQTRCVCGSACNEAFKNRRFDEWNQRTALPLLQDAAD